MCKCCCREGFPQKKRWSRLPERVKENWRVGEGASTDHVCQKKNFLFPHRSRTIIYRIEIIYTGWILEFAIKCSTRSICWEIDGKRRCWMILKRRRRRRIDNTTWRDALFRGCRNISKYQYMNGGGGEEILYLYL